MKKSWLLTIILLAFTRVMCQSSDSISVVISHVFFCIDSISYQNLFKHEFIAELFANTHESSSKTLTDSWTGKYLMGRQSYLEVFAPAQKDTGLQVGDKFGDVGIVFRTKKPGDINRIDSIITTDKRKGELTLMKYEEKERIIPFNYNLYLSNPEIQETFRPYIEEFTAGFLTRCGFTESEIKAGITEEQFREKRRGKKYEKLYDNIDQIELTLTANEFKYLAETLKYVGFSQIGYRFTNKRLQIVCLIQEDRKYKLKAIQFSLVHPVDELNIHISKQLSFTASGAKASFQFDYR